MASGEWPFKAAAFRCKDAKPPSDVLGLASDYFVVSERLRKYLETESPGALEFLPARLLDVNGRDTKLKYWVVNWVRVLDIMDKKASLNRDENGRVFVEVPLIDMALAPPDGVLGLLGGFEVVRLIRSDLMKKIKAEGFTGFQFIEGYHKGEVTFVKPRYRRKKK